MCQVPMCFSIFHLMLFLNVSNSVSIMQKQPEHSATLGGYFFLQLML